MRRVHDGVNLGYDDVLKKFCESSCDILSSVTQAKLVRLRLQCFIFVFVFRVNSGYGYLDVGQIVIFLLRVHFIHSLTIYIWVHRSKFLLVNFLDLAMSI